MPTFQDLLIQFGSCFADPGVYMKRFFSQFAAFVLLGTYVNFASAQQGCAQDSFGNVVCAPPGGGAAKNAYGEVVTGRGGCATDAFGQVSCAKSQYGGAANDPYGQTKTGRGQCVQDALGQVMCSSVAGGGAAVNAMGQAVCTGGCVSGR